MGRTMPSECAHGYIYDWGDFGDECGDPSCPAPHLCGSRPPEYCPEGCNDPKPEGFSVPPRGNLLWVGVDLDGTLAEPIWSPDNPTSGVGNPIQRNVAKLRELVAAGYKPVVYTSRPWTDYETIEAWLDLHLIPWKSIQCGKPLFALYVDDRGRHSESESWLPPAEQHTEGSSE